MVASLVKTVSLFLAGSALVTSLPLSNRTCTSPRDRVAWSTFTDDEKAAYIQADLCLINAPSKGEIEGAVTRWDDLQYPHVLQSVWVHNVGAFLPFHRYYMTVHERLIRDECGYTGLMPYWDELADVDDIYTASVWGDYPNFGHNGVANDSNCVRDGPYANLTLRWDLDTSTYDHCLTRIFNQTDFDEAQQQNIDECMAKENYTSAYDCWQQKPHRAGHLGTGGIMTDGTLSPGDPVFYLHHSYLDKLWWEWQEQDLPYRYFDMGGYNLPSMIAQNGTTLPTPAFTDYFGDGGNITTLNHTLYMAGLAENVTIGEIMDIKGGVICSNYV